jgi:response regulator NasT
MGTVGRSRRILVVDDDRDLARLLAGELTQAGYEVTVADSADEAVAAVMTASPDLAVLDIRMDGKSGLQLATLLRDQFSVPFVFLTGVDDERTVREATAAGALAYIVKSQEVRHSLPTIDAAMARAQELAHLRETETQLTSALQQSRVISMAVGVLMERLKLDRDSAFKALRDDARARRRRMNEIAEELLQAVEQLNSLARPGGQPSNRSN